MHEGSGAEPVSLSATTSSAKTLVQCPERALRAVRPDPPSLGCRPARQRPQPERPAEGGEPRAGASGCRRVPRCSETPRRLSCERVRAHGAVS